MMCPPPYGISEREYPPDQSFGSASMRTDLIPSGIRHCLQAQQMIWNLEYILAS